jgi:hypothetical protein
LALKWQDVEGAAEIRNRIASAKSPEAILSAAKELKA